MPELRVEEVLLSRRGVLKVGLWASAFLTCAGLGASLSGCSPGSSASGFALLRSSDLTFLRALIPVMLAGSVGAPAVPGAADATLHQLDHNLAHLSPELLKLTRQLFDVLAMPVTRGPLTGVWGGWESASPEQIQDFLQRWQNSSLNLLRMGHGSLVQLVMMSWYERPESWAGCGYPGPPKI
ncbi:MULTISPECIES: twin-arginine translocation pathway signal protein [Pseudomonas]|uniref:twin-arginine translocation pathway signal protein n=1 Tax=Pseudomonas TaxID=286 RepID=UPI00136B304D|nr:MULTISPECIES: twin-arginine translocation pathway signal protein [Pseudomonas]NBF17195.1 twin-arginine translocation pathway signal protein [Pseudomonas sp. Fl4BN2]NBG90670.1 twin-arginine translocation pathway signal protein [Pseudomonas sp. 9.1(2019)]NNG64837.1 twin-arginine translocation pathway signal protein [Pseudomonas sp. GC01]